MQLTEATGTWPRATGSVPLAILLAVLSPAPVRGLEPIVPLQLSLSDPGARSLGFGGAFVALADDATAAFANPAGLVQLVRPEVSIEGRSWRYATPYTRHARVEGQPSGIGIDTTAGIETARSHDTLTGISFLSVAYPHERWSVAFFRHQLANFEFTSETQGLFGDGADSPVRFEDQRATADFDFVSYGLSAAWRLDDRFDLGFGVIHHETSLSSRVTGYLWDEDTVAGYFGPSSHLPERSTIDQTMAGRGHDWSLIGGLLWRLSDRWRVGGVYRQGFEMGGVVEVRAGQALDLGVPPGTLIERFTFRSIEFPWVAGLGFAYRAPDGRLTVSFQWNHVQYSTIEKSLDLDNQVIDDADELHVGGEYAFLGSSPVIALRAGAWWDPDHQLRATGADPLVLALQRRGEDQLHLALGAGVALQRFQVDLGLDLSDEVDSLSLSAVYSF